MVLNQELINLARDLILSRCLDKIVVCPQPSDEELMEVLLSSAYEAESVRESEFIPVPEENM